jgi:hypothetical protein
MAARLLLLPLQPFTFTLLSSHSHSSLSHFALSRIPINRQVWWLLFFNNSSCTWVDTFVNGGCNYHWQMVTLLLRVGCSIMANPNTIDSYLFRRGTVTLRRVKSKNHLKLNFWCQNNVWWNDLARVYKVRMRFISSFFSFFNSFGNTVYKELSLYNLPSSSCWCKK